MEDVEIIRTAKIAEKADLEALQMRASLMWEEDREMLALHPEAVLIPAEQFANGMVLVAARGRLLLGFAALVLHPDADAELDGLFVEPDLWRQGIGRRLMAAAERLGASSGCPNIHIIANPRAENFYRRCGYAATGTTELTWRPALLMSKQLVE